MESNNLLNYNQHQLMKRAPTLITIPSLVFLAPTKKGLRSPILKCKILFAAPRYFLFVGHNGHIERGGESVSEQFKQFYLLLINQSISCIMLPITLSYSLVKQKHNKHIKKTQEYW